MDRDSRHQSDGGVRGWCVCVCAEAGEVKKGERERQRCSFFSPLRSLLHSFVCVYIYVYLHAYMCVWEWRCNGRGGCDTQREKMDRFVHIYIFILTVHLNGCLGPVTREHTTVRCCLAAELCWLSEVPTELLRDGIRSRTTQPTVT